MRNVAVILAGGVGTRMGGTMPKQFFKVSGKTVLEHTISVFDKFIKCFKGSAYFNIIP